VHVLAARNGRASRPMWPVTGTTCGRVKLPCRDLRQWQITEADSRGVWARLAEGKPLQNKQPDVHAGTLQGKRRLPPEFTLRFGLPQGVRHSVH